MDEGRGAYPKTTWFDFPGGRIKLSLRRPYYQERRTSSEAKIFFAPENPNPVGFGYRLEAGLKHRCFEYSFGNPKVLFYISVSVGGTFGYPATQEGAGQLRDYRP